MSVDPNRYNIWAGERIRLRVPAPSDVEVARPYAVDSDMQRLGWSTEFPATESAGLPEVPEDSQGHNRRFAIENLDCQLVGSINVHQCDLRHRRFSYGVALFRPYWGSGYAYDAVRVLLRYYFGELGYEKCDVGIYEFNEPSLRLHGRLGFVEEGRRRSSIFTLGRRWDEVLLGMTAKEFFEIHGDFLQASGADDGPLSGAADR